MELAGTTNASTVVVNARRASIGCARAKLLSEEGRATERGSICRRERGACAAPSQRIITQALRVVDSSDGEGAVAAGAQARMAGGAAVDAHASMGLEHVLRSHLNSRRWTLAPYVLVWCGIVEFMLSLQLIHCEFAEFVLTLSSSA
eukprot:6212457-Pleurochrysis_carterae.AAC.2